MWVGDVGQGAREEVDTPIISGGNYGWRVWEGTLCREAALCGSADFIAPVFDYAHSGGRCSLTGGYVYRGAQGVVQQGTYLYGDYCTGEIFGWNGSSQSVLLGSGLSISSFGEDEPGELYVVDHGGTVSRIVSSAACQFRSRRRASRSSVTAGPGRSPWRPERAANGRLRATPPG